MSDFDRLTRLLYYSVIAAVLIGGLGGFRLGYLVGWAAGVLEAR